MTNSSFLFRVGTRNSKLAHIQTDEALQCFAEHLPHLEFEVVPFSTPGDRDPLTDLRKSPADFFTRDLDEALRYGTIDLAIHSAKDLPDPLPNGLEMFWLPHRQDPRDALVLPADVTDIMTLPAAARIGMSSDRRGAWCRKRFPESQLLPIRGTIEQRLEQLDTGRYDAVIIAAAALLRLGLAHRIFEWIPLDELPSPDGQGALAATLRAGDERARTLRSLFVKAVVFAGAGAGRAGTCTLETVDALRRADVCLHDTLLDSALLNHLPKEARILDVGKRFGERGASQEMINRLLVQYASHGHRVIRLKGGDPGIFGRLAEEVEALESQGLPYRVLPGISSLQVATTGTGMLLTRRGESRGFCVLTPRAGGGAVCSVGRHVRASLPQIYFMGTTAVEEICREHLAEGEPPETPVSIVYEAGSPFESIWQSTLQEAVNHPPPVESPPIPGLILIGTGTRRYNTSLGALASRRVLLTCSATLLPEACALTADFGGIPIPFPVIRLDPVASGITPLLNEPPFDWLVLTSPSAAHGTILLMKEAGVDLRRLPAIMVCGSGTARALRTHGLHPEVMPENGYGAESLTAVAARHILPGQRVLRLRSDAAGSALATAFTKLGALVTDSIILHNRPVTHSTIPPFDAVLFASRSSVVAFMDRDDAPALHEKIVAAIGNPTSAELNQRGIHNIITGREATLESVITALAAACVGLGDRVPLEP